LLAQKVTKKGTTNANRLIGLVAQGYTPGPTNLTVRTVRGQATRRPYEKLWFSRKSFCFLLVAVLFPAMLAKTVAYLMLRQTMVSGLQFSYCGYFNIYYSSYVNRFPPPPTAASYYLIL
jgi:hypothetical protein